MVVIDLFVSKITQPDMLLYPGNDAYIFNKNANIFILLGSKKPAICFRKRQYNFEGYLIYNDL